MGLVKILDTQDLSKYLVRVIRGAEKELFLISPFIQTNKTLRSIIKRECIEGLDATVMYKKKELKSEEMIWFSGLEHFDMYYNEDLHAKCYFNEKEAIITSMNLYDYSMKNSKELGMYFTKEEFPELYDDLRERVDELITEAKKHNVPKEMLRLDKRAYCISCRRRIEKNFKKPYCSSCYRYRKKRDGFPKESYCHACGEEVGSTLKNPLCDNCLEVKDFTPKKHKPRSSGGESVRSSRTRRKIPTGKFYKRYKQAREIQGRGRVIAVWFGYTLIFSFLTWVISIHGFLDLNPFSLSSWDVKIPLMLFFLLSYAPLFGFTVSRYYLLKAYGFGFIGRIRGVLSYITSNR